MAEQMPRGRVNAKVINGTVVIEVDTLTAVDMAAAWAEKYGNDPEAAAVRPRWSDDVTALVNAAARAGALEQRVDVPLLRLVKAGEPA